MNKLKVLIFLVLGILLILSATPVFANTPAQDVVFVVPTYFNPDNTSYGPFEATGGAVAAGIICPAGETVDFGIPRVTGYENKSGWINIFIIKKFTCDDGSGEFFVQLEVRLDARGDNASWVIIGGTGDYEDLHGAGRLVGTYPEGVDVLDTYTGMVN
jgi:hypothetical protein